MTTLLQGCLGFAAIILACGISVGIIICAIKFHDGDEI